MVYSPNGHLIATGGSDQLVIIWNSATGALLHTLRGHDGPVLGVSFSPDNRTLATQMAKEGSGSGTRPEASRSPGFATRAA